MKVDKLVQDLIHEVRAAGWSATFTSNGTRIRFRGPQGQTVFCGVTARNSHTVRAVRRELAEKGLDLSTGIPPVTTVRSAYEEAIARRERKLTPQECGEDREPAEVIIRHPKGSGKPTTSTTTTTTITTEVTTPASPSSNSHKMKLHEFSSISEALAAGINLSADVKDAFTDDLTCRRCGQMILTVGGVGPHMQSHRRNPRENEIKTEDVHAAVAAMAESLGMTLGNTAEVEDLKNRLRIVRDAMNKNLMEMVADINKALAGVDL